MRVSITAVCVQALVGLLIFSSAASAEVVSDVKNDHATLYAQQTKDGKFEFKLCEYGHSRCRRVGDRAYSRQELERIGDREFAIKSAKVGGDALISVLAGAGIVLGPYVGAGLVLGSDAVEGWGIGISLFGAPVGLSIAGVVGYLDVLNSRKDTRLERAVSDADLDGQKIVIHGTVDRMAQDLNRDLSRLPERSTASGGR